MTTTELTIHPASGEQLDLKSARGRDLAQLLDEVGEMYGMLAAFKADVVTEVCRRADPTGDRTVEIDGIKFEVNPPTEDVYEPEAVRAELEKLVNDGKADPDVIQTMIDSLIVIPTPKPPAARVDKRRLNSILKTDDRDVLHALALARVRAVNKRSAKIIGRVAETTAEEVNG